MAAIVDYDLGDEMGVLASIAWKYELESRVDEGDGKGIKCIAGLRSGRGTWIDQHTAPIVPRTLAAIGTSISG